MIDITDKMLLFKEAVRHTWNSYFACSQHPGSSETQEAFASIECALLRVIVLAPHGFGDLADQYRRGPFSRMVVKPISVPELPIQFGEKQQGTENVTWSHRTTITVDDSTYFYFYDFFDWSPYGSIDLPFVRARGPTKLGGDMNQAKRALIEQIHCRFMFLKE